MFASFIFSLKHMFDYRGRARQGEYVSYCLVMLFYLAALWLVRGGSLSLKGFYEGTPLLFVGLNILFLLAYLALAVRRLHDFNLSGWWVFMLLVPVPLSFLPVIGGLIDGKFWFYAIWICSWAFFSFYKGMEGANKYGPDPTA